MFMLAEKWILNGLTLWRRWSGQRAFIAGMKVLVTLFALGYIGWRLSQEEALWQWQAFEWSSTQIGLFGLGIALLPLNMGLEAAKWHRLVKVSHPDFSFGRACKAVLTGAATGIFTPNRLGDYAGRLMFLPPGHRLSAALYTFVSRISQMAITLLLGAIALIMLSDYAFSPLWMRVGMGLLATFGLWAFMFPFALQKLLQNIPSRFNLVNRSLEALSTLPAQDLRRVYGLSLIRGAVFCLQYVLLLWAFGFEGSWGEAGALVAIVFLLKSFVPSIALAELGIRESVALAIMTSVGVDAWIVVEATFSLYLINLIFPALLGLLTLHRSSNAES